MSTATLPRPATLALPDEILRGFHPGWFGAVMGTGIVGIAAYSTPAVSPGCSIPPTSSASQSCSPPGLSRS
jgi:hypothetical protein